MSTITIDGTQVPIETIRVHMQYADGPEARPFVLAVPSQFVSEVFGSCPADTRIDVHVSYLISELGTFMMDEYICSIRRLEGKEIDWARWFIARVDEVVTDGGGMVIRGKVVPCYKQA